MKNHPQEGTQKTLKQELEYWNCEIGPHLSYLVGVMMFVMARKYLQAHRDQEKLVESLKPDRRMTQVHESHDAIRPGYEFGYPF